ncbi:MAG: helix-turn-helix domain-containing protein, partial [Pseudomonadota bacterium]
MADDLTSSDPDATEPTEDRARDREEASPGALLRAARLAKKLETREIAATLNVDPWMLDALEHDEYAALGAPVFAKGHLRKYAAALGLDDGDVLVAYYQREGAREAPPLIAESILRVEAERGRGLGWVAPAAGVLALSVIALALFLYLQPDDGADAARAA